MATLLETGYKPPSEPPTMHPFFAQRRPQPAQEKTHESALSNIHTMCTHNDAATSSNAALHPSDGLHPSDNGHNLNDSRRKRRKMTPNRTNEPAPSTAQDDGTWLRQLEVAAGEGIPEVAVTGISGEALPQYDAETETVPPPTTRDASLSRGTTPVPSTTLAEEATESPSVESSNPLTRTLEATEDKPDKSSKRNPKVDASTKASPRRSNRQTRNLTMKSGRIVQSLKVNIPYRNISHDQASYGAKIDAILSNPPQPAEEQPPLLPIPQPRQSEKRAARPSKALHPFFSGKSKGATSTSSTDDEVRPIPKATGIDNVPKPATAWKDIVFSSSKAPQSKDIGTLPPPWPPLDLQHIPRSERATSAVPPVSIFTKPSKQKRDVVQVAEDESILSTFTRKLNDRTETIHEIRAPRQLHLKGDQLLEELYARVDSRDLTRLSGFRDQICNGRSAFDRGMTAGPLDWAHDYAPKRSEDVLQQDSSVLKDWLEKLKVHNVQSKLAQRQQKKKLHRKKRAKKRADDLDDFLVSSEEENEEGVPPVKNAILICGPHGCGKTASVFAAARELDFEVFEIHPGMRRTAKDIYDKVGDMTHNHLVHATASAPRSRASSVLSDADHLSEDASAVDAKQKSLAGFFGSNFSKAPLAKPIPEKEVLQKQSLILFEEVDVIFEEDKTFWSGVQSLIATSKRPIILTCNSLKDIDLKELSLHTILYYTRPSVAQAVEHLAHVAAAEGHLIERDALRTLYLSRGEDLRAALADLDFWCQMTVGSTMGGLDWMHGGNIHAEHNDEPRRIVSKDTFYDGLHLVPEQQLDPVDMLALAQDSLGLNVMDWESAQPISTEAGTEPTGRLNNLKQANIVADFQSCMDMVDSGLQPLMSCVLSNTSPLNRINVTRPDIAHFLLSRETRLAVARPAIIEALMPIMEDFRTFPPPTGRTAPSLDNGAVTVATEVAPYVRQIVWLDQQLEKQRAEIDASSQGTGRQRTTRAARAALEGGDVANTRVIRWFPKELEFSDVLATGGEWHNDEDQLMFFGATPALSRESTDATMVMDIE